jgi:hypothetical protein
MKKALLVVACLALFACAPNKDNYVSQKPTYYQQYMMGVISKSEYEYCCQMDNEVHAMIDEVNKYHVKGK